MKNRYIQCRVKFVFLPTKSWKNHLKKLHTYGSWKVFFSAAPPAQNSPELHFCFINFSIQPSLLESLVWLNSYNFIIVQVLGYHSQFVILGSPSHFHMPAVVLHFYASFWRYSRRFGTPDCPYERTAHSCNFFTILTETIQSTFFI